MQPDVTSQTSTPEREAPAILVVDDEASYRQLIRWALEDEGLAVETAANPQEALQAAARRRPSLAIVDVALLNGSGIALAGDLRRLYGQDLPIITITADGRAQLKARQMRATAWLHKPFDIDDLVGTVRRVLESSHP
jgi:DNA-binding response OmpR family regulator